MYNIYIQYILNIFILKRSIAPCPNDRRLFKNLICQSIKI